MSLFLFAFEHTLDFFSHVLDYENQQSLSRNFNSIQIGFELIVPNGVQLN